MFNLTHLCTNFVHSCVRLFWEITCLANNINYGIGEVYPQPITAHACFNQSEIPVLTLQTPGCPNKAVKEEKINTEKAENVEHK